MTDKPTPTDAEAAAPQPPTAQADNKKKDPTMSFHNKPDYHIPELIEALKAHRLPHDTPSQLADSFRIGWMACRELAQADSVPAVSDLPPLPAPDLRDVGTKPQEIKEFLKDYATEYARTAIAARAPADSVQEDAARYRFLRDGEWRDTDLEPFIRLQLNTLWDAKIDAARKQGGV